MYVNALPRYEILSDEAMSVLDGGWRRIVSELGVEFMLEESVELFRAAGQKVEGEKVFLDPDFVLEQVAKAPREFDLRRAQPRAAPSTSAGSTWSSAASTARRSCARATCGATRRWPTSRTS